MYGQGLCIFDLILVSCIALRVCYNDFYSNCQRNAMLSIMFSIPQPRRQRSHIDEQDLWPHLSNLRLGLLFYLRRLLPASQVYGIAEIEGLLVLLYLMHYSLQP